MAQQYSNSQLETALETIANPENIGSTEGLALHVQTIVHFLGDKDTRALIYRTLDPQEWVPRFSSYLRDSSMKSSHKRPLYRLLMIAGRKCSVKYSKWREFCDDISSHRPGADLTLTENAAATLARYLGMCNGQIEMLQGFQHFRAQRAQEFLCLMPTADGTRRLWEGSLWCLSGIWTGANGFGGTGFLNTSLCGCVDRDNAGRHITYSVPSERLENRWDVTGQATEDVETGEFTWILTFTGEYYSRELRGYQRNKGITCGGKVVGE